MEPRRGRHFRCRDARAIFSAEAAAIPARPDRPETAMTIRLCAALGALALGLAAPAAFAGECPPEHQLTTPREIENAPDRGIKRPILAAVHLKGWRGLGDFSLRMRQLTVLPGGIVPTHWHNDRPSIVYVISGEIVEHSNWCAVPVIHRAGEWTPEFGDFHGHWWENTTAEPVVLISTDVVPWLDTAHFEGSAGVKEGDTAIRNDDM
jgi:uncharacterized cupin superfamily protein